MLPEYKSCRVCDEPKPLSAFNLAPRNADGYRTNCKACEHAYKRAYYLANRARVRAKAVRYYAENTPRARAANRRYYDANRAEILFQRNVWTKATRFGLTEHHTIAEWQALLERYDHRCLACGTTDDLTADHVVPLSRGGTDLIDNIQPLCRSCNSRKHQESTDYRQ